METEKHTVTRLLSRHQALIGQRQRREQHWRELARYCHPSRRAFGQGGGMENEASTVLYDSTAALAAESLASGLFALLTNPAMDWFEFTPQSGGDGDSPGTLEGGSGSGSFGGSGGGEKGSRDDDRLGAMIKSALEHRRHGLYGVLPDLYRDLVTYGTAILSVEASGVGHAPLRFAVRSMDEMAFACNEAGQIDTAFRGFCLSAEQCLERYGSKAPEAAQRAVEQGEPDQKIDLVHVVLPRVGHDPDAVGPKGLAFASFVLDTNEQRMIHEGGYHEFPYLVTRWSLASGTGQVYGESPASLALADIRALNAMVRTNLMAAQKAVDPPLMAVDDNGLRGIKTHPGAIVFGGLDLNGKRMLEPMPTGGVGAVNLGLALEEQRRNSIKEAFHLGLLREVNVQATQTATEFLGRQEERLRLLAPNLGRIEAELLYPLIVRVAAILARSGKAPAMAEGCEVRFLSPLAQAQRAAEAQRLTRSVKALQPFAEAIPSVMERIDTDALVGDLLEYAGLPTKPVGAAP